MRPNRIEIRSEKDGRFTLLFGIRIDPDTVLTPILKGWGLTRKEISLLATVIKRVVDRGQNASISPQCTETMGDTLKRMEKEQRRWEI